MDSSTKSLPAAMQFSPLLKNTELKPWSKKIKLFIGTASSCYEKIMKYIQHQFIWKFAKRSVDSTLITNRIMLIFKINII